MSAIEVSGLKKSYGSREVLHGVSFRVEAGEVFALLGPNGAGKTTTVEILEGYRERDDGTALVLGTDPARGGSDFRSKFRAAFNAEPVWGAHYAYDAMHVLTHTVRSVGSVDKEAVRARLRTIDALAPVTSTMRFNATGEQLYGAITVYQRREGAWMPIVRSDQW